MEHKSVLYASWYNCPAIELQGYTPINGKRSFDGSKTWTDLEVLYVIATRNDKIMRIQGAVLFVIDLTQI